MKKYNAPDDSLSSRAVDSQCYFHSQCSVEAAVIEIIDALTNMNEQQREQKKSGRVFT